MESRRYFSYSQGVYNLVGEIESEVAQSCPTLCDPMDCSPPRFSVHGIFQAGVLEWVAISFSRESYRPRDRTQVSRIVNKMLYHLSHQGSNTSRRDGEGDLKGRNMIR